MADYHTEIKIGRKMVFPVENYDSEKYGWVGWYPGCTPPRWGAAAFVPMPGNERFLGYYATFEAACNAVLAEATPRSKTRDYHTALTRILKWAREHTYNNWSEAGDAEAYANGPAEELIDALADAGFEIDADECLVIHGERVRE